ncbi:MAG: hypothetical protein Q7R95_10605 [bacterium]|nr:hypothetical protein [bacterium]
MLNNKTKEFKFIEKVLKKMFQIVGAKHSLEFCKEPEWYVKYTWDQKQEKKFKDYFIKLARKDFKMTKNQALKEYQWFVFDYGWKSRCR